MSPDVLIIAHNQPTHNRVLMELDVIAECGFTADLICLRGDEVLLPGVRKLYRMPVARHRGAPVFVYVAEYLTFFLLASILCTVLFARHRYRTVIVHSLPDPLVFAAWLPRLLGAGVLLNLREFTPELIRTRLNVDTGHALVRIAGWLERLSCAFATHVITVHETGADLLESRAGPMARPTVIVNTIDFEAVERREAGDFTLLYHGNVGNEYDLLEVVDAIDHLRRRDPSHPVRLRIVGSGTMLEQVRSRVAALRLEDRVTFEAPVPFERIPSILSEADAGVPLLRETPYAHLGVPTKLLECVAAGVPVVAHPGRAIQRYFSEDTIAYVPFGDSGALADAIQRLRDDPAAARALAARAKAVLISIRPSVMRDRYRDLLQCPDRRFARGEE